MNRPRLLDLFCCAGGAAMGYHRAGFDVVGVDIKPQKNYPFPFILGDALDVLRCLIAGKNIQANNRSWYGLDNFMAIHASPPCQDFIPTIPQKHGTAHFLPDTRDLLLMIDRSWIIENIPNAPLRADFKLCGCMFGLPRLRRQRWFETSWHGFALLPPCYHPEHPISVTGHGIPSANFYRDKLRGPEFGRLARLAMGIDWMTRDELSQAIPPAYTEFIGKQLLSAPAQYSAGDRAAADAIRAQRAGGGA